MFLIGVPLLVITFAIYNMIAFLTPGVNFLAPVFSVHMVSGAEWPVTVSDVLLTLALVLLFIEIIKATRIGSRTLVDHMLSTVLFIVMIVEFILLPQAATSTFFLLIVISLVDVIGGYSVTIRTSQRDIALDNP
ncbi:MAG TPA: hypothetical protein VL402_05010 [Xanthobacteraceae bacterium]|jgi:hypothetical protein|nr:hypothetical protein [Xanthobacteraceae bacterium]